MRCFEIDTKLGAWAHERLNNNMRCFEILINILKKIKLTMLNNNMRCFEIKYQKKVYNLEKLNNNMRCFEIRS